MATLTAVLPSFIRPLRDVSWHTNIVSGREAILRCMPVLNELSTACGQEGTFDDLDFFLSRPAARNKIPHVLFVTKRSNVNLESSTAADHFGAVLIFEYRRHGRSTGTFSTEDNTGQRTLVAERGLQSRIVTLVTSALLKRGAQIVLISYRPDAEDRPSIDRRSAKSKASLRQVLRTREALGYLALHPTYDATLAAMGHHTRKNFRYYRKQAIKKLGCTFSPDAGITREEFLELNRNSTHAVPDEIAAWRYDAHSQSGNVFLSGIQDDQGRWLSIIGGRRFRGTTELHWQMNRADLANLSLATVARSYLIEHAAVSGDTRLYIEGGTGHSMRNSFTPETVSDSLVLRPSLYVYALKKLADRVMLDRNILGQMLRDNELQWVNFPNAPRKRIERTLIWPGMVGSTASLR